MSSSPIEDQINAGWAYILKALALVQRNYNAFGHSSTSARLSAEKAGERLIKAEQRIKYLEDRRGELTTETSSLKGKVSVLEGQVNSRDAELGSLRRQLDSLRESWDVESRQLVTEALSDFHAKASERMVAAKGRLLGLKQEFISPCLASTEVVDPEAESALTTELIGIARLLRLPRVPSPPIEDGVKGSSLEFLSAKIGVTAQAGSNLYSPVVDALLAKKRSEELVGAGISTGALQGEQGPSEVPASQTDAEEIALGEENPVVPLPSAGDTSVVETPKELEQVPSEVTPTAVEVNPPLNANEAGDVVQIQEETEQIPADVTPTPVEVQDEEQIVDPLAEVKTPPAKQTPGGEEEKNSSGQSNIWDQIVL